jgi:hypothetical protein
MPIDVRWTRCDAFAIRVEERDDVRVFAGLAVAGLLGNGADVVET